jgi:hypothetical protein
MARPEEAFYMVMKNEKISIIFIAIDLILV